MPKYLTVRPFNTLTSQVRYSRVEGDARVYHQTDGDYHTDVDLVRPVGEQNVDGGDFVGNIECYIPD